MDAESEFDLPSAIGALPSWPKTGALCRSRELTPLYVERYVGPRSGLGGTRHGYWEFTAVMRGEGVLSHGRGQKTKMTSGQVLLVPPGLTHAEFARRELDTIWVGMAGSRLDNFPAGGVLQVREVELCRGFEEMWLRSISAKNRTGPELDGRLQMVFAAFLSLVEEAAPAGGDSIDLAVRYMQSHFRRALTVAELARRIGASEGHFHREFKRRTGASPMQFLTKLRIQYAMHALVHSTLSVEQVARSVGYEDALYFSRIFRKHAGVPPREFRIGSVSDNR